MGNDKYKDIYYSYKLLYFDVVEKLLLLKNIPHTILEIQILYFNQRLIRLHMSRIYLNTNVPIHGTYYHMVLRNPVR